MKISIAIPTLGRDAVLITTVNELLQLNRGANEIIIVDQSDAHNAETTIQLQNWHDQRQIQWIRIQYRSITHAMNIALRKARSERILFLDDDIIPDKDLINAHLDCAVANPSAIIAGRVLQPWHNGKEDCPDDPFLFNTLDRRQVTSFMGGNVSIPRVEAIRIGGFDTNFVRVAYHFEAEFAYRWISKGYEILYESKALIHHLKTERGGTRTYGNHLTTVRPDHTVGRHYYYLCRYLFKGGLLRSLRDLGKSILTKHHLRNPLWIPFTLISEITGLVWALVLFSSGRGTISGQDVNLLIISSHPIQYYSPIFCKLDKSKSFKSSVLYLTPPNYKSQSLEFEKEFSWNVSLLKDYNYHVVNSFMGKELIYGFMGFKLTKPWTVIRQLKAKEKPDVVLITGWHLWGIVQLFIALKMSNIPIILRIDSNSLRQRTIFMQRIHRILFSWVDLCLTVGKHNQKFCIDSGVTSNRIIKSPDVVDNEFFFRKTEEAKKSYDQLRESWNVPTKAFCFIYAGRLHHNKRPLDLLKAFKEASHLTTLEIYLLVVGAGSLENSCKNYSSKHKLAVSFVGFLNQSIMPKAYAISDCIVLPSDEAETWGHVINEAMACGLPAIVSNNVGCCSDLVQDGLTGLRYQCGDTMSLARNLVYMAENAQHSKKMGRNAQRLVHSEYTLEKVADSIELAMCRLNG